MLLWGSSRGRGHKKFITEQCESGEFLCSLWRKLLASFHSFISRYLLIDFQTLFHHGYGCRENVTLGVPPPIIILGRHFPFTIKTFIHFPHFVSCGPQLTLLRSKAVRRHFFSMSLFGSGNQLFNIAAVAVFLWVIFTIVSCLGNAAVTETAAECYWKSMVKAGLDRYEDHSSLSWFLPENRLPHDSNSRINWNPERIRNPVPEILWITLCGATSSSGCLETSSGRGYCIDRRADDCKRDEFLGKTFLCSSPIPLEFSWD